MNGSETGSTREASLVGGAAGPSVRAAWFYACLAVALWASNVIPVKLALREIHGLPASLMRVTVAGVSLLLLNVWEGQSLAKLRLAVRDFISIALIGIVLSFVCFTTAIEVTSVSHVVFIGALLPLLVLCVVCFQGQEQLSRGKMLGFVLALTGITLLEIDRTVLGGSGQVASSWRGDLLAIGGVFCFTFYTVRGKQLAARYDSFTVNTFAFGLGAAVSLFLLTVMTISDSPRNMLPEWQHISGAGWTSIIVSGTLGSALPYFLYCRAMERLKATEAATLAYVQPVIATLLGVAFLNERVGAQFVLGAALILVGVGVAERR